jgi:hypothetical protein
MKTYSEREVFSQTDLAYYRKASRFVRALPSYDQHGEELRCHEVARAVAIILNISTVEDGYFELACQHTWLVLPTRHILDPYCVGRLPPVQLVAVVTTMPKRYNVRDIGITVRGDVVLHLTSLSRSPDGIGNT